MSQYPQAKHTSARLKLAPSQPPGAFVISGGVMDPTCLYSGDLVFEHEATAATGIPGTVIRKWASRGKIRKFPGRPGEFAGRGHEHIVMYALPEIRERAKTYRPMPQRTPKAA